MNIYSLGLFYLLLGVILNFPDLAVKIVLIEKGISVAGLAYFNAVMVIPWCIKPVYGLLSDTFPIFNERRRPYIIISNLLATVVWIYIGQEHDVLSVTTIKYLLFLLSVLTCFSDVMYDSLLVVEAKSEGDNDHGKKQSICWILRAVGATLSALLSGVLLMNINRRTIFFAQASMHLFAAFAGILLVKESNTGSVRSKSLVLQTKQLIRSFCSPKLRNPAIFMFMFGATPSSYMPFFYYLVSELKFSTVLLGTFKSIRHAAMLLGTIIFRRYLRNVELRTFFMIMVISSSLLGATPLVLITHMNRAAGIPDSFFVGGDDLFLSVFGQISILPILVLAAKLCKPGIEASLYAAFVSILNYSGVISEWIGASLTKYLEITNDNFQNLPLLIAICTTSTLLALAFLGFLPAGTIADQVRPTHKHKEGAIVQHAVV